MGTRPERTTEDGDAGLDSLGDLRASTPTGSMRPAQEARATAQAAAAAQLRDELERAAQRWREEHGTFGRFRVSSIQLSVVIELEDDGSVDCVCLPVDQMPSLADLADELGWPALAQTTSSGTAVRALLEHARRQGAYLQVKDVSAWLHQVGLPVSNASQLLVRLVRRHQANRVSHGRFVARPGALEELLGRSHDRDDV